MVIRYINIAGTINCDAFGGVKSCGAVCAIGTAGSPGKTGDSAHHTRRRDLPNRVIQSIRHIDIAVRVCPHSVRDGELRHAAHAISAAGARGASEGGESVGSGITGLRRRRHGEKTGKRHRQQGEPCSQTSLFRFGSRSPGWIDFVHGTKVWLVSQPNGPVKERIPIGGGLRQEEVKAVGQDGIGADG